MMDGVAPEQFIRRDPVALSGFEEVRAPQPVVVARWDGDRVSAVAFARRPADGILRYGVAVGEETPSGFVCLSADTDPWEDAATETEKLARGPVRIKTFGIVAHGLESAGHGDRRTVCVAWGVAHAAVSTMTVAAAEAGPPVAAAPGTGAFVVGVLLNDADLERVLERGGLPLYGHGPSGEVVAEARVVPDDS